MIKHLMDSSPSSRAKKIPHVVKTKLRENVIDQLKRIAEVYWREDEGREELDGKGGEPFVGLLRHCFVVAIVTMVCYCRGEETRLEDGEDEGILTVDLDQCKAEARVQEEARGPIDIHVNYGGAPDSEKPYSGERISRTRV
jgi:hypothetical protein